MVSTTSPLPELTAIPASGASEVAVALVLAAREMTTGTGVADFAEQCT